MIPSSAWSLERQFQLQTRIVLVKMRLSPWTLESDRAMESSVSSDGSVTKSPATKPFWTQKTRASIRSLIPSRRASSGLDKSPPRHPAGSVSVVADSRM